MAKTEQSRQTWRSTWLLIINHLKMNFLILNRQMPWFIWIMRQTALKPQAPIDATSTFYQSAGSVHRSQYEAAQTAQYENARHLVKTLINAEDEKAVIWTSGTTHSINLVANGLPPLCIRMTRDFN